MNLKMIVTQLQLLPESAVVRHINSVVYPLRRGYLIESTKDVPNLDAIQTMRQIEMAALDGIPTSKVHTLESTASFIFNVTDEVKDEAELRNEIKTRLLRMVASRKMNAPRSKQELEKMITLEIQRDEDSQVENLAKAARAVHFVETLANNEGRYDEAELPEWVTDQLVAKIVNAAEQTYQDARRKLDRAKYTFQKTEPEAAMAGALALLKHFGVDEDEVRDAESKALAETQALFERLEQTPGKNKAGGADSQTGEPTIDNPPVDTDKEKKTKFSLSVELREGGTRVDPGESKKKLSRSANRKRQPSYPI